MKKTKPSHRILAVFLTLNFLTTLVPTNFIYASGGGPGSPEAASFEPVDATDMVNLATGDLSYVIPLLNVPSPEGGYPLALSYHAGIALDQEASWVGLGWNINPGAINRSVVGVPDDWKNGLKSKISFDAGGTTTIESLNLPIGVTDETSVALNTTWVTNKTVGGEKSIDFQYNVGVSTSFNTTDKKGINHENSIGFSIGNNGFSVGLGRDGNIIGLTHGKSGTGISFASRSGNTNIRGNISFSDRTKSSSVYSTVQDGDSWYVNIFGFKYSRVKFKYWRYDEKDYWATGSLYAGKLDELNASDPLYYFNEFDATESPDSRIDGTSFAKNNPSYITYDIYNIDAQGLNISASPKLLELGKLHSPWDELNDKSFYIHANDDSERYLQVSGSYRFDRNDYGEGTGEIKSMLYEKSLENPIDRPNFYIENEYSSYHQTNITDRTDFLTNQNEAEWFNLMYHIGYTTNDLHDGFNNANKKLKKSTYIEVFTNQEIQDNQNVVLQVPNLSRNGMPMDGIGAYKVTSIDGKTYHYSLPVYQKEKGSVVTKSDKNIAENYFEEHSLHPYATHWLLTGITGPDFVDDGDNIIDDGDFGYWVRFDYGKWSDGYTWRMPKTGFNYTDNAKSFSWGAKDIYYLNSIVTRTHTALFVKDVRLDNNASPISKKEGLDEPIYREAIFQGGAATDILTVGTDGYFYWAGAYERLEPANDILAVFSNDNTVSSKNWFYYNSSPTPTLFLKEIILLKNDKVPQSMNMLSMSDGNQDPNNPLNFKIHFEEQNRYDYKTNNNWIKNESERISYVDNIYRGEYFDNVIDVGDYDFDGLKHDAVKSISFWYQYALGNGNLGPKLSLKSVETVGKGGTSLIPPYRFAYYDENSPANISRDDFDDWGYYKPRPYLWSLKEIQDPLGGKILMEYESDDFFEKSVASAYLDHNLQVKFEGTNQGSKYVSVRQDPDMEPEQVLDLTNYFSIGDECELDIQYFYNPQHNGHNWIADVAGQGVVTDVSNTVVKFQIPTNSNKGWVRLKTNCHKKNWVYYQSGEYGHVVDKTVDWKGENRELYCHQPEDEEETIKIRVHFNQSSASQIGGGIRTKKVTVQSEDGTTYETQYQYNQPGNNNALTDITSGTTSYAPVRKYQKNIPYIDLQPSPGVLYQNVRVTHPSGTYSDYAFNTLTDYTLDDSGYESNVLKIAIDQGYESNVKVEDEPMHFLIDEKFYEVENNLSSLGALISKNEYNPYGQLTNSIVNTYFEVDELQGEFTAESYVKEETVGLHGTYDMPVNLSTTRISYPPSVLKETRELVEGNSFVTTYGNFDLTTGKATEVITSNSKGIEIKSKNVPAYLKYPAMGSKVDNPSNRNMLAQEAATYQFLYDNDNWEVLNAKMYTWRDWGDNIWRKHKTYRWNGETNDDGFYVGFDKDNHDDFNWNTTLGGDDQINDDWKQLSEITQYNDFSSPLEVLDINGNLAATKMGYDDSKTIAVCNAGYGESFYSGAEDDDGQGHFGGGVEKGTTSNTPDAHTGNHALSISNGGSGFEATVNHNDPPKRFKISLWAKNNNYKDLRINVGGNTVEYHPSEIIIAGDWVQLNFYSDIPTDTQVHVTSVNGTVVVDDFRLHPISSSMTSYVYNQWDELTDILGPNNLATKYEYDEAGRLLRIYSEVQDVDGQLVGGFKKVKEYAYAYKSSNDPYDEMFLSLGVEDFNADNTNVIANVNGGSGQFEYQWSVKSCDDPDPQDANVCPGNLQPTYGNWTPQNFAPITTNCDVKRAVYWCRVKDLVTQNIVEHSGNHKRGGCNDDDDNEPNEEEIP